MSSASGAGRGHNLVAVIGCTGTGKSQLAVELAQHVAQRKCAGYGSAEVISADSMQVYRGLDVITNKASEEEMGGVKHHLMSFVSPGEEYTIKDFTMQADSLISKMHLTSKHTQPAVDAIATLPIVAGGTSYYVQHLLFPGRLVSADQRDNACSKVDDSLTSTTAQTLSPQAVQVASALLSSSLRPAWNQFLHDAGIQIPSQLGPHLQDAHDSTPRESSQFIADDGGPATLSSTQLWNLLNVLDPDMAARWHPNDQRKIKRSLVIFATTGKAHSVWLDEQKQKESLATRRRTASDQTSADKQSHDSSEHNRREGIESLQGGGLGSSRSRKRRKLLFWVWCEPETLKTRLDGRIHKMIERGLLDEIRELRAISKALFESGSPDYTRGIFQAIGFKEFDAFLTHMDQQIEPGLSHAHQLDQESRKMFDAAVESMQRGTRQYARRQTSWIRNQLLSEVYRAKEASLASPSEDLADAETQKGDLEIYLLDATDLTRWEDNVAKVAKDILEKFLDAQDLPDPLTLNPPAAEHLQRAMPGLEMPRSDTPDLKVFVTCPVCSFVATSAGSRPGQNTSGDEEEDEGDESVQAAAAAVQTEPGFERPPFLIRATEMEKHKQSRRHRMAVKKMNRKKFEAGKKAEAEARRKLQQQAPREGPIGLEEGE